MNGGGGGGGGGVGGGEGRGGAGAATETVTQSAQLAPAPKPPRELPRPSLGAGLLPQSGDQVGLDRRRVLRVRHGDRGSGAGEGEGRQRRGAGRCLPRPEATLRASRCARTSCPTSSASSSPHLLRLLRTLRRRTCWPTPRRRRRGAGAVGPGTAAAASTGQTR